VSRRDVLKFGATTPALIGLGFAAGSLCAPSGSSSSLINASETYSNKANTTTMPTPTEVGGVSLNYYGAAGATWQILNGRLTLGGTLGAGSAAYCDGSPPAPVTYLTIQFVLAANAGTTTDGIVALRMGDSSTGSLTVPVHLVVSQTYAQVQKYINGTYTSLILTDFSNTTLGNLPMDNTTVHKAEISRSGSTITVYIDGLNVGTATDPDIGTYTENYSTWEVRVGASTDNVPGILFGGIGWGAT
jgi:hypothetical protein